AGGAVRRGAEPLLRRQASVIISRQRRCCKSVHDSLPLSTRLPLLVTGITGVAGYNAFRYFRRRYPGRVVGLRPRKTWRMTGDGVVALDAEDRAGLRALLRDFRFGAVLNCVGNCALKSCELDPAMARVVNVASADALAEGVRVIGCR